MVRMMANITITNPDGKEVTLVIRITKDGRALIPFDTDEDLHSFLEFFPAFREQSRSALLFGTPALDVTQMLRDLILEAMPPYGERQ
jgi:hypothetical protein